jgi:hypothetical protein
MEGQVPVFISPRNRVAQLYPRALGKWITKVPSVPYEMCVRVLNGTVGTAARWFLCAEQADTALSMFREQMVPTV